MQLNTQVPSACANLWHDASDRDGTRAGTGVGASSNSRCISSYVRFLFESKRMYSSIICSPSEFFCGRAFISQLQINSTHSSGHHKKGSAAKWRTVNTQHNIPPTHTHTHRPTVQTNALTHSQAGRQAHSHAAGRNNISQLSKLSIKYFRIFYQKRKWLAMAGGSGSTHITQLKSIQSQLPLQQHLQLLLLLLYPPPPTQPFSMSLLWQVICFF